jgi:hypothetical protein
MEPWIQFWSGSWKKSRVGGFNQQFTTGFQKKIFSKISVLILELGLGLVLVLEQKLMIDSNFEIFFLYIV